MFSLFMSSIRLFSFADTPAWKAEKNGSLIFIGGAVHF
jgi:hypothetical protein